MGDEGKETIIDATVWNTETSKVSTFYGEQYDKVKVKVFKAVFV